MNEITLKKVMNGRKVKTVDELGKVCMELADSMLSLQPRTKHCISCLKPSSKLYTE